MVSKQPGKTRDFEKDIFRIFANFWVTKLKQCPGKVKKDIKYYLNQNLVTRSFLENGFETTLRSKTNVLSVWKGHFSDFCRFLSDKVKIIFWESEAKRDKDCLNQNLVISSFLENSFGVIFSSKMNILHVWKGKFSVFCKFSSDEDETAFWESEAMLQKLFRWSLLYWDHIRKCFSVFIWSL